MRIESTRGVKKTSGNVDAIIASGNALLTHTGKSKIVVARDHGSVIVRGQVTDAITGAGESSVVGWGNQKTVKASDSASVAICGSPVEVVAEDDANISIFGEPKRLTVKDGALIRVVSLNVDYTPESEFISDDGMIELYKEGEHPFHFPRQELRFELDELFDFPDPRDSNHHYIAYLALFNLLSEAQTWT